MFFIRDKLQQKQYEVFIKPHVEHLHQLARRLCQNSSDADDITQDLLIKLYQQRTKIYAVDNPKPYLSRALYNQFVDFRRRQGKHINMAEPETELDSIAEIASYSPENITEQDITFEKLSTALAAMPDNHRTIIVLHDMEGYTFDEISDILDIPKGTAKSRLHRARETLKSKL